jgi:hypothetical protein
LLSVDIVAVPLLIIGQDRRVPGPTSMSTEALQPGELGEGGAKAGVAVGAVGRDGAPGDPLTEAADGEALVEGQARKIEVDATTDSYQQGDFETRSKACC